MYVSISLSALFIVNRRYTASNQKHQSCSFSYLQLETCKLGSVFPHPAYLENYVRYGREAGAPHCIFLPLLIPATATAYEEPGNCTFPCLARTQQEWPHPMRQSWGKDQLLKSEINHCPQPMGFDPGMSHNASTSDRKHFNKCGTLALRRGYSQYCYRVSYAAQQQDGNKIFKKSESSHNNIVQNCYLKTPVNFQLQFKDIKHNKAYPKTCKLTFKLSILCLFSVSFIVFQYVYH